MSKHSWPMKKIGDLFDVQLGKMLNEKAKQGDLLPYLANFNVRWGAFDLTRLNEMTFSDKEQKKFSLERGDLLMCEGGEIGRCAVWEGADQQIYFQKALHRLRPLNRGTKAEFYCYFMQHIASKGDLPKLVGETSIAHLTREKLVCLRVPAPPLPEQTSIASLLSTWDLAIEKTEQLIVGKEKQKKSLMQSLLTGKQRIKGFQKPWSEYYLGKLFKERAERGIEDQPLISITRENGIIPRNEDRKDTSNEDKSKYLRICPGDIGYNTMRMWQGVSALSSLEGIVSPAYTICTPKKSVDGEFMAYLFKLPRIVNLFYRHSQGLTSDTWNLKYRHFQEIKVAIPEIEEQQAIAKTLKVCDEEIGLLKKELAAFQKQKRGLMQRLLTGEWRVRVGNNL